MTEIQRLTESYARFIEVPWMDVAPAQRVIFCVYDEDCERRLRASMGGFEAATREAGHGWAEFDLTDTFAEWLSGQLYASEYFENPEYLDMLLPNYLDYVLEGFEKFVSEKGVGPGGVVAVTGLGSLFGFLKVNAVVEKISPMVDGRLLVFFPGSCESNNYRLLDAYDGWNYHAVLITANKDY